MTQPQFSVGGYQARLCQFHHKVATVKCGQKEAKVYLFLVCLLFVCTIWTLPRDNDHSISLRWWVSKMETKKMATLTVAAKPIFCIVLADGDRWSVEAEWPDGTIERIDTFETHFDAINWITARSNEWVRGRT